MRNCPAFLWEPTEWVQKIVFPSRLQKIPAIMYIFLYVGFSLIEVGLCRSICLRFGGLLIFGVSVFCIRSRSAAVAVIGEGVRSCFRR
jgi:hypothetical protein